MDGNRNIRDMLGRSDLFPREETQVLLKKFYAACPLPGEEEIPTTDTLGRVVSRDLRSPENLPPFTRSTMDGYAVRGRDTFGATEALPAYLALTGKVAMGKEAVGEVGNAEAMKIATGGMLPEGADAVVMLEYTSQVDDHMLEVTKPVAPGENVIRAGEDMELGEIILKRGHRIRPQDIGALCGVGVTRVPVFHRPRVAVIPTGDEIIPPDRAAAPGQVRDINSYHLSALIEQAGGLPVRFPIIPDDEDRLREAVERAVRETSLVILSGGSSVGTRDLTARILASFGGPGILVHGVAVKPGKPTLCALIGDRPVFGLPGHPAAVVIGYDLFVRPWLRKLSGEEIPLWDRFGRQGVRARITRSVASRAGREDYIRVALEMEGKEVRARPILGKSGLISTLVDAAGTVVIPENQLGVEKGEEVDVRLF